MDVDADNIRHRQEEEARRAKRKEARVKKTSAQLEKETRRKEHAKRVLQQQQRRSASSAPSSSSTSAATGVGPSGSGGTLLLASGEESKFQALFQKRTDGFVVDFMFRNAPPRPPVGPCFVGLGLEGELNDKWTRYKPHNAIEVNHVWKLHVEPDLGVPLASAAIQFDFYVNPTKKSAAQKRDHHDGDGDDDDTITDRQPTLHPDDEALLNWKGSLGDTAGEALQLRRDYARAAARMQHRVPHGADKWSTLPNKGNIPHSRFKVKQSQGTTAFTSRVLQERNPFFMRKTTYLHNDTSQSVHAFKSLTETRSHFMEETSKRLREQEKLPTDEFIEQTFDLAKTFTTFYSMTNPTADDDMEKEKNEDNPPAPKKTRVHPTKKNVVAVAEYPLFPNTKTWNKSCIHVAMDHLPKKVGTTAPPTYSQMQKALIMDVRTKEKDLSTRMECNILVPKSVSSLPKPIDSTEIVELTPVHKYDLEVVHVKDDSQPLHNTFLFVMDKIKGVTTYHPISSRVNLSSGRPISIQERNQKNTLFVQPDHHDLEETRKDTTRFINKRPMSQDHQHDNDDDEEEEQEEAKTHRRRLARVLQDDSDDDDE